MKLEEEIGQKRFRSGKQRALINIIYTNNFLINRMNSVFKEFDITRQQFNVLRILRGEYPEPVSINTIKERMLDKMSDASRIVERLRVKGLLERVTCADDRRAVDVKITDKGLTLLENSDPSIEQFDNLLNGLSDQETEDLNKLLDKIRTD
jgi:DNA-binding MarR family transcriptional regulator